MKILLEFRLECASYVHINFHGSDKPSLVHAANPYNEVHIHVTIQPPVEPTVHVSYARFISVRLQRSQKSQKRALPRRLLSQTVYHTIRGTIAMMEAATHLQGNDLFYLAQRASSQVIQPKLFLSSLGFLFFFFVCSFLSSSKREVFARISKYLQDSMCYACE